MFSEAKIMATLTKYAFQKEMDIPSLEKQIQSSSIVTVLDHIDVTGSESDIWFKDALSSDDQSTLNIIVSNYVYIAPPAQPPTRVVQILGADTVSICPFGTMFDAPANQTTTYDLKITNTVYLKGGIMYATPGNVGDIINVQVVDKDNITGYGVNTILATYVNNWYVIPQDMNAVEDVSLSQPMSAGLYIRFVYTNSSVNDSKVIVNLLAYQGTL
jgi:hypothetical protein